MITSNPLLAGARGGLGKTVVFKQMYGKTVMTNYPRKVEIPREKQSAAQRGTRDNFRDAVAYAKAALKDPVKKAYYEKKKKQLGLTSAYQAAITDYLRKLKLESLNLKKYTGATHGQIVMTVTVIESGNAVKDRNGAWECTTTMVVDDEKNVQVRVMAQGPAGNWEVLDEPGTSLLRL